MPANTDRHVTAVARYFEAWNATGPEELTNAVAAAWTEDGTYTDPLADVRGHAQLAAVISAAHEQFPGFAFRLTGSVDGHHDTARFSWELVSEAGGAPPGEERPRWRGRMSSRWTPRGGSPRSSASWTGCPPEPDR